MLILILDYIVYDLLSVLFYLFISYILNSAYALYYIHFTSHLYIILTCTQDLKSQLSEQVKTEDICAAVFRVKVLLALEKRLSVVQ